MRTKIFVLTLLLAPLAAPLALAQRLDQIFPVKGTPISGIITVMSPIEVTINVRGDDRKVSVLDIKRLTYGEEPRDLTTARDNLLEGQYESGLENLKKIDASAITRDFIKQDYEFFQAYAIAKLALSGKGDLEAGNQALMKYARGASKNFHFTEAAELLGEIAIERERYEEAAKFFGFLAKTAREASWPEYAMKIAVTEGRILGAQDKPTEALQKYDAVLQATNNSPEAIRQKNFAKAAKASLLAEMGQIEEGLKLVDEIVQQVSPEDTELFGRAYNAQGRLYLKADRPTEALLAFLHVDLLFNQHPDIHAEALFHLNKLWTTTNKMDRAAAAKNTLAQQYAASRWTKQN